MWLPAYPLSRRHTLGLCGIASSNQSFVIHAFGFIFKPTSTSASTDLNLTHNSRANGIELDWRFELDFFFSSIHDDNNSSLHRLLPQSRNIWNWDYDADQIGWQAGRQTDIKTITWYTRARHADHGSGGPCKWVGDDCPKRMNGSAFASSPPLPTVSVVLIYLVSKQQRTAKTYDVGGHENAWGRGTGGMLLGDNKLVFKTQ